MTENHASASYSFDLFALGEALVDLISSDMADSLGKATHFQRFIGGQVTNLVMNMAHLGKHVSLAACVGEDGFGHFINERLEASGVPRDYIQFSSQAVTTISIITRHTQTPDFVILRGADSLLGTTQALESAVASSRLVHTSAFGLSREPARSTILRSLAIARQNGNLVSLDPNYHPKIWPDVEHFTDLLAEIFQYVDIIKPSIDDCVRLFGPGLTPAGYAEHFLLSGCKIVALTMGAKGLYLATNSGDRYQIHGSQIQVADITGAGDAFWAGFLSALLEGKPPIEAACLGQVLAEIKVGTVGPVKRFPDLNSIYERSQSVHYVKFT